MNGFMIVFIAIICSFYTKVVDWVDSLFVCMRVARMWHWCISLREKIRPDSSKEEKDDEEEENGHGGT